MDQIISSLQQFWEFTGFCNMTWQHIVMIAIGIVFITLAIVKEWEPLLLGPMADDEVWDYVEDFLAGRISREAFWTLAKFKHPTHQILFCTDRALKTLNFKSYYQL